MRRRLFVLTLIALAGCGRYSGPLENRQLGRADGRSPDGTAFTIEEQKVRGRERLSVTEDDFRIGPKGYIDRPSPTGR